MKKIFATTFLVFLLFTNFVSAANLKDAFGGEKNKLDEVAGKSGYETGEESASFEAFFGTVVQTLLSLIGVFFLALMIYGGFLWMTDRGNSDQVERAKKLITAAVIGIIIIVSSYAISYFVIEAISTPTLK